MINWNIVQLERSPEDSLVIKVHWEAVKIENYNDKIYTARTYGALSLERGKEFIPFEQLTKEIVVDWIKEKMGIEQIISLEESLAQQIENQKNPPILTGVPW